MIFLTIRPLVILIMNLSQGAHPISEKEAPGLDKLLVYMDKSLRNQSEIIDILIKIYVLLEFALKNKKTD